jgi:hypothetical protein
MKDMVISSDMNKMIAIVMILTELLFHKGYVILMDNFYSSQGLAKLLKSQKTGYARTLNKKNIHVPS